MVISDSHKGGVATFGRPEEIAPAVVFLASGDASWLTRERINASGGVH